ncbi:MAG: exodeoxyribonuclease VII small subunit [Chloroflexota bacterium]|nr:exodeoxyribonuclease VII small subunit [Chloroflexota bacterium]
MDEQLTFEQALERLEKIVLALQDGGLTLEESIALYEEGMGLARICNERLNAADLKITQLQTEFGQAPQNGDEPLP